MKLRFYIKNNNKVYTLKQEISSSQTKDAHYKFLKFTKTKTNSSDLSLS